MEEEIKVSIKSCDKMKNCEECSKTYDDKTLIPCNHIRLKYGVSIWDYKTGKGRIKECD